MLVPVARSECGGGRFIGLLCLVGLMLCAWPSRAEAIQAFHKYLALEQDSPVTHQRLEQARARLKELEG